MEVSAKELYANTIRRLSPKERLRLAALIINDFAMTDENVEFSETWSEQDLEDLSAFALSHSENPHEKDKDNP